MSQPSKSRAIVYGAVLGLTASFWLLRSVGLLTFIPGFVLLLLIFLSIGLTIVNGLIETR